MEIYDIIVIGGGPAGLTAAIYARRASRSVLVLEAVVCGGQIVNTPDIENYPVEAHVSGYDFATRVEAQARGLGAGFAFEKAVGLRRGGDAWIVATEKGEYRARAVILATGAAIRKLGLPDEDRFAGRGVSYCATCDGAFYRGKTVAVVGGGNTALEDALYLADLARKVYLVHRREGFRGEEANVARLRARENVEFVLNATVSRLVGEKSLSAVEVADARDGSVRTIELEGLFVAVGRIPENRNFADVVELDPAGYVVAGEDCRTGAPGVFVAGDNRAKVLRQLVTATADGAVAATAAVQYVGTLP